MNSLTHPRAAWYRNRRRWLPSRMGSTFPSSSLCSATLTGGCCTRPRNSDGTLPALTCSAPLNLPCSRLPTRRLRVSIVRMDRKWFPMFMRTRDDHAGVWVARSCAPPPPSAVATPAKTSFPRTSDESATRIARSLVTVECHVPYMINGLCSSSFFGVGVVVDAESGLVVVDRHTAPIALGDVIITLAASLEVPGAIGFAPRRGWPHSRVEAHTRLRALWQAAKVLFMHATHNFAVLQYDPSLLAGTPVQSIDLSDTPLAAVRCLVGHSARSSEPRSPLAAETRGAVAGGQLQVRGDDGHGRVRPPDVHGDQARGPAPARLQCAEV